MKSALEFLEEKIRNRTEYGTTTTGRAELLKEYAELLATEFCEWTQRNHFVYTTSPTDINHKYWVRKISSIITTRNIYSTNQLYEQFMIERSRRTQNNECVIPAVSVSVCKSPKDYICNVNDNGICGLPTSCVYKHTER